MSRGTSSSSSHGQYHNNNIGDIEIIIQQVLDESARIVVANFPVLKQVTMDFIDLVFCPKTVAKQLALAIAIDAGMVTVNQVSRVVQSIVSTFSSRSRLIRQLKEEQNYAKSQDEWMELAERIDNIQSNDIWRSDPDCPLYERERIAARIDEFIHLMRRRDVFDLMFELRGSGIGRNKFGLLHEGLFSKAMAGSKVLVETYHNVVCATLDFVCDSPSPPPEELSERRRTAIPTDARLAFFNEMRHAYGRTALILSGGAALGFYHGGVVKTLMLNNLMPRVIAGSSAGSIVSAMVATRTDEEWLNELLQHKGTVAPGHSGTLRLDFFRPLVDNNSNNNDEGKQQQQQQQSSAIKKVYNNTAGAFHDVKRTWQGVFVPIGLRQITSALYDVLTGNRRPRDLFLNDTNHFRECVKANIGNFTFQEAFDRTGRILNIVVTPTNNTDPPRLLNYLTAPHVLVWSAAVASASLPGVFEANRLMVRDADGTERYECASGQKFNDGSLEQDLPMDQLSEMFNVNHFIISQANPHAVMFGSYNQTKSVWTNPIIGMIDATLLYLKEQLRSWFQNVIELISVRRITPMFGTRRDIWANIITQEYEGRDCDISLIPWHSHLSWYKAFFYCVYNPTPPEFFDWIEAAERETWKYLPAIKSHIAEEITLDLCVQRLRKRLIAEQKEKKRLLAEAAAMGRRGGGGSSASALDEKLMGEKIPSFFTSPSLVNFGGLCISDRNSIEGLSYYNNTTTPTTPTTSHALAAPARTTSAMATTTSSPLMEYPTAETAKTITRTPQPQPTRSTPDLTSFTMNSGWGGMGLSGNRSNGSLPGNERVPSSHNLERAFPSASSGLFIDEDDHPQPLLQPQFQQQQQQQQQQVAGENTTATTHDTSSSSSLSHYYNNHNTFDAVVHNNNNNNTATADGNYVKTASMAQFYYHRNNSRDFATHNNNNHAHYKNENNNSNNA